MSMVTMAELTRAYGKARDDLAAVGVLAEGRYLDRIECMRSPLPAGLWRTCGWVYDGGVSPFHQWIGFEPGVIYIPANAPVKAHATGLTLTDVIRHEFAHAWYWLDEEHVDGPWFRKTFHARYQDTQRMAQGEYDRDHHVSTYAMTNAKEDFAETFMTYLRFQRSLDRFRSRAGVYAKLMAVEDAVRRAAAERIERPPPG